MILLIQNCFSSFFEYFILFRKFLLNLLSDLSTIIISPKDAFYIINIVTLSRYAKRRVDCIICLGSSKLVVRCKTRSKNLLCWCFSKPFYSVNFCRVHHTNEQTAFQMGFEYALIRL